MSGTPVDRCAEAAKNPVHLARDILRGTSEARIVLGDQTYLLRLTRAGKLILTK